MSEIKNYRDFRDALCEEFETLKKKYEEQLIGVPVYFKFMTRDELIQFKMETIFERDDKLTITKKDALESLKNSIKWTTTVGMFTYSDLNKSEDVVMIDRFRIIASKDRILYMINNYPDWIDYILKVEKLVLRHEFGHCMDMATKFGMSWNDYRAWYAYADKQHTKQLLKKLKNNDYRYYVNGVGLCIDGVPFHYYTRDEIAANRKAEFNSDELQLLYYGLYEFTDKMY